MTTGAMLAHVVGSDGKGNNLVVALITSQDSRMVALEPLRSRVMGVEYVGVFRRVCICVHALVDLIEPFLDVRVFHDLCPRLSSAFGPALELVLNTKGISPIFGKLFVIFAPDGGTP